MASPVAANANSVAARVKIAAQSISPTLVDKNTDVAEKRQPHLRLRQGQPNPMI